MRLENWSFAARFGGLVAVEEQFGGVVGGLSEFVMKWNGLFRGRLIGSEDSIANYSGAHGVAERVREVGQLEAMLRYLGKGVRGGGLGCEITEMEHGVGAQEVEDVLAVLMEILNDFLWGGLQIWTGWRWRKQQGKWLVVIGFGRWIVGIGKDFNSVVHR